MQRLDRRGPSHVGKRTPRSIIKLLWAVHHLGCWEVLTPKSGCLNNLCSEPKPWDNTICTYGHRASSPCSFLFRISRSLKFAPGCFYDSLGLFLDQVSTMDSSAEKHFVVQPTICKFCADPMLEDTLPLMNLQSHDESTDLCSRAQDGAACKVLEYVTCSNKIPWACNDSARRLHLTHANQGCSGNGRQYTASLWTKTRPVHIAPIRNIVKIQASCVRSTEKLLSL